MIWWNLTYIYFNIHTHSMYIWITFWGHSNTNEPLYSTHPSPSLAWWYWQQSWCQNKSHNSWLQKWSAEMDGWGGGERERERESNLTPSCLSLAPIGAYPYMWKATLGALYTSRLFRAIVLITLLIVAVALRNFIWGYHSVSVTLVQTLNLLSGGNILSCVFGLDFIRLRLSFIVWVQLGLVFMGYYLYLYFLEAL